LECPTKLFYTKKKEYLDSKMDDSFLAALAEGGFQVGELAKHYYAGGHDITTLDYEKAENQTNELLKQDKVIIYEPAIRFNNLFIRIDILVKNGNKFDLIEVKAKSFDNKIEDVSWQIIQNQAYEFSKVLNNPFK
jgi:predicted RecB family nuclease